jgi:beta-1,4-mannosyl-glycoprotein beta-1,4-N-acetylglucosaminyltransferase
MVYDCTQLFNELDLLEMRLNILDPHVDFFVIGESTQTFSGLKKPLYYKDNKERFSKWSHKIIHIEIPEIETGNVYERTAFQKDYLRTALESCGSEDTIYYGDVDEIWNPQEEEGKLRQLNYCYYINQRSSEDWQGTNVCRYKNLKNLNELRADHSNILEDGGWHFTNMGGLEQLKKKIEAYDHQEMINDDVREKLQERIENGEDYLGRSRDWQGNPFTYWLDDSDLPEYVMNNKNKYVKYFA